MRYIVKVDNNNLVSSLKKHKEIYYPNDKENKSENKLNYDPKYTIQNWQFQIRKLTYEDAGTYQCLLPLVKPLTKNITLQVIRKSLNFFNKITEINYFKHFDSRNENKPEERNTQNKRRNSIYM